MSPALAVRESAKDHPTWDGSWDADLTIEAYVLEAWSQGFMIGALIIMAAITVSNMSKLLLHKLILIELFLAMWHGTFCFMQFTGYGYYVSTTAVLLYSSWYLHNIIAWMKTKPFLQPRYSKLYICTFLLTTPYWILETYGNYTYNNNINQMFLHTRPLEALARDPWWVFTCINLVYNIKKRYGFSLITLVRTSPRFGVMLVSMIISIVFFVVDMLSSFHLFGAVVGINPYWKLSLVFKCLCDAIILDDFRSALEKIRAAYFKRIHENSTDLERSIEWRRQLPGAHQYGNSVDIKSVPRVFSPRTESEKQLNGKWGGHHRVGSTEEDRNRIYVSTDVVMNRERNGHDDVDDVSAKSVGVQHEQW